PPPRRRSPLGARPSWPPRERAGSPRSQGTARRGEKGASAVLSDPAHLALLIAVGLSAGFLSGIIGMGGALLLVPALAFVAGMPFKLATGTASLHGLAVGLFGYLVHGRYGAVDVRIGLLAGAGSVVGGIVGAAIWGARDAVG